MLSKGSRGLDVKELQQDLNTLGFYKAKIDGFFGEQTEGAVLKFQGKNKPLKADGVVGPKTQVKLREQVKKLHSFIRELDGLTALIDPGHGGDDPGAVDPKNPKEKDSLYTEEEDINLAVGLKLQSKLAAMGARVTVTRGKDEYPSLRQRCDMAKKFGANIFISLHCNSGPAVADGIETLYNPKSAQGKRLATIFQEELVKATKAKDRKVKPRTNLFVLNENDMPSVIIEMGFITNPGEENKLNSSAYQNVLVDALAKAIVRFKKGK